MEISQEVTKQRRTVMGQIDYSLQFITSLKKQLMDVGSPHSAMNWAIGGFVITLFSSLLHEIQDSILSPKENENKTAIENLNDIKKRFNGVIDLMLKNIEPETPKSVTVTDTISS
jgi:hypothetical protein